MRGSRADCNVALLELVHMGFLRLLSLRRPIWKRGSSVNRWHFERQMPAGMCLRPNWGASHIADPGHALTLDAYCRENGNQMPKPIPLERFVAYGRWYQHRAVPNLENRQVRTIEVDPNGFKVRLADGERFSSERVIVATGIGAFVARPLEFDTIPSELASPSSEHHDLRKVKGRQVVVIGAGRYHSVGRRAGASQSPALLVSYAI
jgi:hypothetical protein